MLRVSPNGVSDALSHNADQVRARKAILLTVVPEERARQLPRGKLVAMLRHVYTIANIVKSGNVPFDQLAALSPAQIEEFSDIGSEVASFCAYKSFRLPHFFTVTRLQRYHIAANIRKVLRVLDAHIPFSLFLSPDHCNLLLDNSKKVRALFPRIRHLEMPHRMALFANPEEAEQLLSITTIAEVQALDRTTLIDLLVELRGIPIGFEPRSLTCLMERTYPGYAFSVRGAYDDEVRNWHPISLPSRTREKVD